VPTARLLDHDRRRLSLKFDALVGVPLGPKYPDHLADDGIDAALTLGEAGLRRVRAHAHARRQFAHGDLTPRNVLALEDGGVALIDRILSAPDRTCVRFPRRSVRS